MSNTPNIDELQQIAQNLHSLLIDPHPGLFTWRESLDVQLASIRPFLPPVAEPAPPAKDSGYER